VQLAARLILSAADSPAAVYYGLDLLLINSYIWFKDITGTNMSQKNYCVSVIDALIARYANMGGRSQFIAKRKRTSDTRPIDRQYPMRMLGVGSHFPQVVAERLHCKLCYINNKQKRRTQARCTKCNIPLCLKQDRNCFLDWHTME
jgi:hypothetical protein